MVKTWRLAHLCFIEIPFVNDISISTEYKPYEKCCCCKSFLEFSLIERHHFFRKPSFWIDLQLCINHLMGGRVQLQMRKEQQRKGHQGWWTEIKHKILVLLEAIKVKRFTTENNLINCSIIKRMLQIFSVIWFLDI